MNDEERTKAMHEYDFKTRARVAIIGDPAADEAMRGFWRDTKLTFRIRVGVLHSAGIAGLLDPDDSPTDRILFLSWDELMWFWHWWATEVDAEECQDGACAGCIIPDLHAVA